jgi:hypothetical protein
MASHLLDSLEALAAFLRNWVHEHGADAADPARFWQVRLEEIVDLFKRAGGNIPVEQLADFYRSSFVGASSLVDLQFSGSGAQAANAQFAPLREAASSATRNAISAELLDVPGAEFKRTTWGEEYRSVEQALLPVLADLNVAYCSILDVRYPGVPKDRTTVIAVRTPLVTDSDAARIAAAVDNLDAKGPVEVLRFGEERQTVFKNLGGTLYDARGRR